MIANRILPTINEESFVIRYFNDDKEVLSLVSDYQTTSFVLHECPFTTVELFDIILPRNLFTLLDEVYISTTPFRKLNIRLVESENLFELDFSNFNRTLFGLEGVRDFIFNEEALEKLKK